MMLVHKEMTEKQWRAVMVELLEQASSHQLGQAAARIEEEIRERKKNGNWDKEKNDRLS